MNNFPSWLKAQQNGSIGEIRTKAFLMDRFWILERSVDIHGADFIIQKRLYEKNLLDDEPPRFGVVQAKFSQDSRTTHNIKKEYILDQINKPRIEYFLIIHSGDEECHQMFLLTAKDIVNDFPINNNNEYVIASNKVILSNKYKIVNRKFSLNRIEQSINCAEFSKNRLYVFHKISSVIPDFEAMLPEYKEDIEHSFGFVSDVFKGQKQKAFDAILQIEIAYSLYVDFLESIDPIEAFYILEKIKNEFGASILLPELFDRDFYSVINSHKDMVDNLRNDGALDNYISAKKLILDSINIFFLGLPIDNIFHNSMHIITIDYDSNSLRLIDVVNSLSKLPENEVRVDFYRFIEDREGHIVFSWRLGLQFDHYNYLKMNNVCLNVIMEKIYALKYYDNE